MPDAREALTRRYEKMLREQIKPVPLVQLMWLEQAGAPVLAMHVPQASAGPVSTHENEIWIRKGATNRRPDALTELPDLYERAKQQRLSGWPLRGALDSE